MNQIKYNKKVRTNKKGINKIKILYIKFNKFKINYFN